MNKLQKVIIACFVALFLNMAPVMAQCDTNAQCGSCKPAPAMEFQANKACFVAAQGAYVVIDSVDNTIDICRVGDSSLVRESAYLVDIIEHRYDVKDIIRPVDVKVVDDHILFLGTSKNDSSYLGILDFSGKLVATYPMSCHSDAFALTQTPCGHAIVMVAGFNKQGYSLHTFVKGEAWDNMVEQPKLTTDYHRPLQSERIKESDPVGVGLTVIAILVVFLALVFVACMIALLSKIIRASEERKAAKEAAPKAEAAAAAPAAAGNKDAEVYAAIAAAIHMYMDELHDEESNIITIEEKCTPWNSKAYNMNQTNLKK